MSQFQIKRAVRKQAHARIAITGSTGSGKTYTALRLAHQIVQRQGGKICVIDTESESASLYADEAIDGYVWGYDTIELDTFSPAMYTSAIRYAASQGYTIIIVDSLSHAWSGKDGALAQKDKHGESWRHWRKVNPIHYEMVETLLRTPVHIIACMRSKMEYVQETDEKTRKQTVKKLGLAPIQRAGIEYEFTVVLDMDLQIGTVTKTRCSVMRNASTDCPGPQFFEPLLEWLENSEPEPEPTTSDVDRAMCAVGPSGASLDSLSFSQWQQVANSTTYVQELRDCAKVLVRANPSLVDAWRKANENASADTIEDIPDEVMTSDEHAPEPEIFDDTPVELPPVYQPTMDDITAAMTAVGPSGDPLGKFDRLVWGKVAAAQGEKYTSELKKYARLLLESTSMVVEWRNTQGDKLDTIAAQDSVIDKEPPPEID